MKLLTDGTVPPLTGPRVFIKRFFDLIFVIPGIIILSPVLLAIILAIELDSAGPIFFLQERVGRDGRLFSIMKFRTMIPDAVKQGLGYYTAEDDPRITRVGRFLRKWSLDELPQLFNVLKGDMSLVGPRPTLKYQVDEYTSRQMNRLLVKPGITGLAQVSGRNVIAWPERIEIDIDYIKRWSIWLDVKIMFKTIGTLFARKGVYVESVSDQRSAISGKRSAESGQLEDSSTESRTPNAESLNERKD